MFEFLHRKKKPLRQRLLEAKENVERQLSIMRSGPINNNTRWQPDSIDELERTLHELEKQIAHLDAEDAQRS